MMMKIFRMLGRSIRDAFKSVFRNFSLSLASISCITITLVIVAVSIIASFNVENFTKEIEGDLTIVVFLENDATEEDVDKVTQKIKEIKNVDSYKFQGKEEVKDELSQESDVFKSLMSEWSKEDNPLKDTYQIKVRDAKQIGKTAKTIKEIEKVSLVRYGEGMVEKLVNAFASIEKVSYGVVIALILVTIFLIINTIKLTIFSRKREISIMRLVGASNFSIKTPFIIEGMFLGLIGSILPVVLTTFGYLTFYNHFNGYLFTELIQLIKPEPFIYQASGIIVIIGILVGMIGSASAVRKYLKV
ncbi:MAG: ABC transporter permease [Bacilli bacterium]|nr:ABC transporter permease [Bacilli bacterium]